MIKIFFVFLALANATPYIEPELNHYISEFVQDSQGKVKLKQFDHLTLKFDDLGYEKAKAGPVGVCYNFFVFQTIKIDRYFWHNVATENERWGIIYHEFAHCILNHMHSIPKWAVDLFNIEHNIKDSFCPYSLMYPYNPGDWCIMVHKQHYIEELFNLNMEGYDNTSARWGDNTKVSNQPDGRNGTQNSCRRSD